MNKQWKCPYCGGKNSVGDRSCPGCGCMQQDAPQPRKPMILFAGEPVGIGRVSAQSMMAAAGLDYDAEVQRKLNEPAIGIGTLCPPTPRPPIPPCWPKPDGRWIGGMSPEWHRRQAIGFIYFVTFVTMVACAAVFWPF